MGIRFNADEVLEMAAQIERNGAMFYRRAAEINPGGKEFLHSIAEQEDLHLALFEDMRKRLQPADKESTAHDPGGEASLYLKVMADGHVFDLKGGDPSKVLRGSETLDEIIAMAIRSEKDSIAFFVGVRDLVPEHLGKDKIDALIREEMKHIRWLNDRKVS